MPAPGPRLSDERRRALAQGYEGGGRHYEQVRPGYPAEAVQWLFAGVQVHDGPVRTVADVGAGTGKYTRMLAAAGLRPTAVDPSADMLGELRAALPQVPVHVGTAEHTGLPAGSVDAVTVAQAWHWCDPLAAGEEFSRILRPGGVLGLVWNQLDVSVPWVHRFTRISHAGDVLRPGFRPEVGPRFRLDAFHTTAWSQPLRAGQLPDLARSRSWYRLANARSRERMEANLDWYLYEHLGHRPDTALELPYLTYTWRARLQEPGGNAAG